jgi:hypothetical protein
MISHWILFLLIGILMQPNWLEKVQKPDFNFEDDHNDDIRQLYKFLTLGLGGFIR